MDNRAPPQNYNLIQGWSVSKSNQRYSHDAVPSLKFPVSFSADYHLCVLYIQSIEIVQEKFDDFIKQFDPSSNIFLHYLGCPGKARFLPIIFINNECRMTSGIEASESSECTKPFWMIATSLSNRMKGQRTLTHTQRNLAWGSLFSFSFIQLPKLFFNATTHKSIS